jgi:hypothetical protein
MGPILDNTEETGLKIPIFAEAAGVKNTFPLGSKTPPEYLAAVELRPNPERVLNSPVEGL